MFKKLFKLSFAVLLFLNICGFSFLAASVADSQKIKQVFNVSYGDALIAVKDALRASNINFKKAEINEEATQVRARYAYGMAVRIWIYRLSDAESRIEVRAGTSENDMPQAQKLMDAIALCMPNK